MSARAIATGQHIPLARISFPPVTTEIFLDLEGTGAQTGVEQLVEMDYLIGAHVRRGGQERYHSFLAETPNDESVMWREFTAWLAEQDASADDLQWVPARKRETEALGFEGETSTVKCL